MREAQGTKQVHFHGLPPVVEIRVLKGAEGAAAIGAIDQRIDSAEALDGLVYQILALLGVSDVRRDDERLCAGLLNLCLDLFEKRLRARGENDLGALLAGVDRELLAEP